MWIRTGSDRNFETVSNGFGQAQQCCGTVAIFYGSGSDFCKVMVPVRVPVPVPTFEKLRFRFRFQLHIYTRKSKFS